MVEYRTVYGVLASLTVLFLITSLSAAFGVAEAAAPPGPPRLDSDGYPLPRHAQRKLGTSLFRLRGGVYAAAPSPDGKAVAFAEDDGLVLYDVLRGRPVRTLARLDGSAVNSVRFLRGGQVVVAATFSDVRAWDAASGKLLGRMPLPEGKVMYSAASQGGTVAVAGDVVEGVAPVSVHDLLAGREVASVTPIRAETVWAELSPDGGLLATGGWDSDGGKRDQLQVWDARTGKEVLRLRAPAGDAFDGAFFSPDGKVLATRSGTRMRAWDVGSGKQRWATTEKWVEGYGPTGFSPDGRLVYAAGDREVGVWEVATGRCVARQAIELWPQGGVVFPPGGKPAVWLASRPRVQVWDAVTGSLLSPAEEGHIDVILALAFTADGRSLHSMDCQGRLLRWAASTGVPRPVSLPTYPNRMMHGFDVGPLPLLGLPAFAPDGATLALPRNKADLLLVDLGGDGRKPLHAPEPDNFVAWSVAFSRDGRFAAVPRRSRWHGGRTAPVPIWDAKAGKEVARLTADFGGDPPGPSGHAPYPSGAVALDGRHAVLATIRAEESPPGTVDVSGWALPAGRRLWKRSLPTAWAASRPGTWRVSLALSPDGRTALLAGHGVGMALLDVATGRDAGVVGAGWGQVSGPVFSPDGRTFAVACVGGNSGPSVRVVEWTSLSERLALPTPAIATALAFSRDGARLASAHADTTILLWDLTGGSGQRPWEAAPAGK